MSGDSGKPKCSGDHETERDVTWGSRRKEPFFFISPHWSLQQRRAFDFFTTWVRPKDDSPLITRVKCSCIVELVCPVAL